MAVLRGLVLGGIGALLALVGFDRAAAVLSGSAGSLAAHLGLAGLALGVLALAWRPGVLRPALTGLGLGLLALTAASAWVLPGLIRAEAARLAEGRAFCLVGPARLADRDPGLGPAVVLAPAPGPDLTFLTLPRPLTLVIERPADTDPTPAGKPDPVFLPYDWDRLGRRFRETEASHLREPGDSRLLDCVPRADPFAAPAASEALVVWRDPVLGDPAAWGPRQRALLRLPVDAAPVHAGRFRDAGVAARLPVLPDGARAEVTLTWAPDPAAWLRARQAEQVRDADQPLDWAALPVGPAGLPVYEVPSPTVADGTEATHVLPGPDGQALTVIDCAFDRCRHHARQAPDGPVVLTIDYPRALLADWRAIEDAARASVAAALGPPD